MNTLKKAILFATITIFLSVVINAHFRDIQIKIHDGISWVWQKNEKIGEAIFEVNAFLLNGDAFDHERRIKDYIFSSYPSVVMISVFPTEEAMQNPLVARKAGRGTGFFVKVTDTEAYVMTNYHVVESYLDNKDVLQLRVNTAIDMWDYDDVEVVGYDLVADLAIVKIKKIDDEKWEALEFADYKEISEGDPVVVIGHGLSLPWTNTQGIVTYDGRFGQRPWSLVMQIDAVINQGNSGGPVIGEGAKVYGVAQSILSPARQIPAWDGVGFAIGARQAQRTMDYIMSDAYAEKGYVPYVDILVPTKTFEIDAVKHINRKDRHMSYVEFPEPVEGEEQVITAGEIAGLQNGDVILQMDGKDIYTAFTMLREAMYALPGDKVTVTVLRGTEELEFELIYKETNFSVLEKSIKDRNKQLQR